MMTQSKVFQWTGCLAAIASFWLSSCVLQRKPEEVARSEAITSPKPALYTLVASLNAKLAFEPGSTKISEKAKPQLDQLAQAILVNPKAKVRIDGFADGTGSAANNDILSKERADAVRQQLIMRGVKSDQVLALGGGENPVKGRRAEISVA